MTTPTVQQTHPRGNEERSEAIPEQHRAGVAAVEPGWATVSEFFPDFEPSVLFSAPFGAVTATAHAFLSAHGWTLLETRIELPVLSPDAGQVAVDEVPALIANLAAAHAAVTGAGRTVKRRADATAHLTELDG